MYIGKQIQAPYVVEIAQLGYSISLKNGCSVEVNGADLVQFMELYVPEIDLEPYIEFSAQYLKYIQSIDLVYFIRNQLNELTQEYFYSSLYEWEIDACTDSSDEPRFEKMKAEKMDEFLDAAFGLYDSVKRQEKPKLQAIQPLSSESVGRWTFSDGVMSLHDDEIVITLTDTSITQMAEHFKRDFIVNGEANLKSFENGNIDMNKYISLDYFLAHFEEDVKKFKADGLTFKGFIDLMTSYKICDKFE